MRRQRAAVRFWRLFRAVDPATQAALVRALEAGTLVVVRKS